MQVGDPGFAGVECASLVALGAAGAGAGARWMVRVVTGAECPPLVAGSTAGTTRGAVAGAIAGEFVSESA